MTGKTRLLRLSWTARWTTTVSVEVPDEPLTRAELNAIMDAATADAEPGEPDTSDAEHDDTQWVGEAPEVRRFGRVPPVPDDAWIEVLGERWATSGTFVVREGAPLPSGNTDAHDLQWRRADDVAAVVKKMLEAVAAAKRPDSRPIKARFHRSFASILRGAGDVSLLDLSHVGALCSDVALVWREGMLAALVAPLSVDSGNRDSVNAYGEPFPSPEPASTP